MKKSVKIIAVAAACACLLGASGCASANNTLTVDSYWYIDSFEGIQRTSVLDNEENANRTPEVLLYELLFDETSGGNSAFHINYFTDGEDYVNGENPHYFKTTFYAAHFDWNGDLVHDNYRLTTGDVSRLPEEDQNRIVGTSEVVYVLETEMYVSGQYVLGNSDTEATDENSVEFDDYMITTTYFRSARNTLEPVYSKQEVHTTTPASMAPANVEDMCLEIEYVYKVFYNFDCTEATYTYTEISRNGDEGEPAEEYVVSGLKSSGYTLFDNNTLYTAVRGMSLSENFSATGSLFVPANFGIFNVNITGGAQGELDSENDADIVSALTSAYYDRPADSTESEGEEEDTGSGIYYNPVSMTSSATLHGTTQTAWFAAVNDEDNNTYRATMLRLLVPLSYGLGTIEYRLKEVESVLGAAIQTAE